MGDSTFPPVSDPNSYFAPTPAKPPSLPPPAPTVAAPPPPVNQLGGPPVNQFGTPVNQFGTPVNQFGTPNQVEAPVAAPPAGWSPYPVTAPAKPARQFLIIAAAIGVVVIGVVAAVVVFLHNRHSLSLPQTADGYPLMTDPKYQTVANTVVNQLNSAGGSHAIVGFYGTYGAPVAAVIATHTHGDASNKLSAMEYGLQSVSNAPMTMTDESAGKLGGKMQCGAFAVDGRSVPTCAWSDSDTIGAVEMFETDAASAPSMALTFRQAVEH